MPKIIRNTDISSILFAAPTGHRHLRLAVRLEDGTDIVLQEATAAAITRVYTSVKTHPVRRAAKLVSGTPDGMKDGYAERQLIETDADEADIVAELEGLLGG
jgi:hypothetical protein